MQRMFGFAACFAFAAALHAQVSIGVFLPQEQYLPGEAMPVSVRVTNFSGQTMRLGTDTSWLQFSLEAKTGYPVRKLKNFPVQGVFDLENANVATKRVDIAPCFEQMRPGRYILSTIVRVPGRESSPLTVRREIDVINGTVRWEQMFGVPVPPGETRGPDVRIYALQQASSSQQLKLYARVTNQNRDITYGLLLLGPLLTFSETEQQIDKLGHLHVLYQYGARSFYYYVITPDCTVLVRQTHDYDGPSRPRLRIDAEGRIDVKGGVRRRAKDDVPAVTEDSAAPTAPSADAAKPAAPSALTTN